MMLRFSSDALVSFLWPIQGGRGVCGSFGSSVIAGRLLSSVVMAGECLNSFVSQGSDASHGIYRSLIEWVPLGNGRQLLQLGDSNRDGGLNWKKNRNSKG